LETNAKNGCLKLKAAISVALMGDVKLNCRVNRQIWLEAITGKAWQDIALWQIEVVN